MYIKKETHTGLDNGRNFFYILKMMVFPKITIWQSNIFFLHNPVHTCARFTLAHSPATFMQNNCKRKAIPRNRNCLSAEHSRVLRNCLHIKNKT